MDPFAGENDEPLSLHKYLYAHADPINNIDPSGLSIIDYVKTLRITQLIMRAVRALGRAIQCVYFYIASWIASLRGYQAWFSVYRAAKTRKLEWCVCSFAPSGPGEILKRSAGGPESANRLGNQARKSLENPLEGIHGISVTAGTPRFEPHAEAVRSIVELFFPVFDTPMPDDPFHRTVQLPDPVTPEVAKTWNELWGFKKCKK